jgi:hypothetical protein
MVRMALSLLFFVLSVPHLTEAQSFLETEAGISASCKITAPNLTQAITAYKNIEYQTSDYIIGSVAIPNYTDSDDAHVYLNISGDMIAYYLNTEKPSKIIDWKDYHTTKTLNGSKLQTALTIVADATGRTITNLKYFDFRYPQALSLKIISEEAIKNTTNTFRINIPSSYTCYSRSYSHAIVYTGPAGYGNAASTFAIDGTSIDSGNTGSWRIVEGDLTASQLSPDVYHTVSLQENTPGNAYVAVVLLYTEP